MDAHMERERERECTPDNALMFGFFQPLGFELFAPRRWHVDHFGDSHGELGGGSMAPRQLVYHNGGWDLPLSVLGLASPVPRAKATSAKAFVKKRHGHEEDMISLGFWVATCGFDRLAVATSKLGPTGNVA